MKISYFASTAAILCALLFFSCDKDTDEKPGNPVVIGPNLEFYGLTAAGQLVKYNANNPAAAMTSVDISGMVSGEKIVGIDFRPNTGQLFGLGNANRLYNINITTGKADTVASDPFTAAFTAGAGVAFDFNPTVDRLRIITSSGVNLRVNPENGLLAATDGTINPGTASISAAAYTNSVAGATTTTLYDIDVAGKKLVKQDPPNTGALVDVGILGVNASGDAGFDISPDNSAALAVLNVDGVNGLYSIDLTTGIATNNGKLGTALIDLAIPTNPVAYSIDETSNALLIFNFKAPGTPVRKTVSGLQVAETIVGIDMRPKTGQLYAIGSSSRIYTINISSGVATAVGMQLPTLLAGTSFGVDFNPTVDRIRVVSNVGQNLRLHPVTGAIAATDLTLNPGTPAISGAAYTNNTASATTTVLYDIDFTTDRLYMQIPPNNGTLVEVGTTGLGINAVASNGFDIGGGTNTAYALLTVGSASRIYSINLSTGVATGVADFPGTARGFAIGLGF